MIWLWMIMRWTSQVVSLSLISFTESTQLTARRILSQYPHWTVYCNSIQFNGMLAVYINSWVWQLSCGIHVSSALLLHPPPVSPLHSVLTANLYSDIKPDDSPIKGTKRGKGKKEKKKPAVDPLEKKKPKLDELKVLKWSRSIMYCWQQKKRMYLLLVHGKMWQVEMQQRR